jgi:Caspase domain
MAGMPAGAGAQSEIRQALALDPGQNLIEVIAYEGRNLLASRPARATIVLDRPPDAAKPKLHVLAIGINAYIDKGGTGSAEHFPPLNLAVADARAFAGKMREAGAGLYGDVLITEAFDDAATKAGLDRIFDQLSPQIGPRDTFVLYAAAHGISREGRFYLIPQDYQGGGDPGALSSRAITQAHLQDWLANRIRARKAIILLDTCESGALVNGYDRSRMDLPDAESSIGRLHEATGRPVLTAAASGKPAFEGYKGHGVFTYALMEALHSGDSNGDGNIELSEFVIRVQDLVPQLSAELSGRGIATVASRGFKDDKQSARFGSTGEDFVLARRLP